MCVSRVLWQRFAGHGTGYALCLLLTLPYFVRDNASDGEKGSQKEGNINLAKVHKELNDAKIDYLPVEKLETPLTDDEIISKVGGGDLTKGSCSSAAFAYIGNKCGYDVTDFRGDDSLR